MIKQSDIVQNILSNPKIAEKYSQKYIEGIVKEQLFLKDYKSKFGSEINEDKEEDEVELDPEEIPIEEPEIEVEPEVEKQPEPEVTPEPEIEVEPEEEPEIEPEELPTTTPTKTEPDTPTDTIDKKEPEGDGYIRISPKQAQELLSYKGKIFTAIFTKRSDGSLRALNGMTGVRKYTSGGELPYSPKEKELIPVYDLKVGMGSKGYRTIPLEGLKALNINGKKYKIDQSLEEIKVVKPKRIWDFTKYIPNFNPSNIKIKDEIILPLKYTSLFLTNKGIIIDKEEIDNKIYYNTDDLDKWTSDYLEKINEENNIQENMKKTALYDLVKEVLLEMRATQPQRVLPDRETITKPETDTPERKPKRRTLTPPTEAPETKPKAEGVIKENEEEIAKKIADRFSKLK
jgi:hypothetical protein